MQKGTTIIILNLLLQFVFINNSYKTCNIFPLFVAAYRTELLKRLNMDSRISHEGRKILNRQYFLLQLLHFYPSLLFLLFLPIRNQKLLLFTVLGLETNRFLIISFFESTPSTKSQSQPLHFRARPASYYVFHTFKFYYRIASCSLNHPHIYPFYQALVFHDVVYLFRLSFYESFHSVSLFSKFVENIFITQFLNPFHPVMHLIYIVLKHIQQFP